MMQPYSPTPRYLLAICIGIASWASLQGQTVKRDMADKYFGYLEFYKATPIYDELAGKAVRMAAKGKAADWEAVRRAAQANSYTRKYNKSSDWYAELARAGKATADDYRSYFEVLRYTGDYSKSDVFLDTLRKLDAQAPLVKEYTRQKRYAQNLRKDSADYAISEMPFNKGLGDFGPAFYEKGLVFASSRKNNTLNRKYAWDNTAFLNVYYAEKTASGEYKKGVKRQNKKMKTRAHDGPVCYTKDNKKAFITRNRTEKDIRRGDVVTLSLYVSEKGTDGKWGVPQPFPYNSTKYSVGHAALSPDEKTLYFVSDMPGSIGGTDIWKCEKQAAGWATPVNLGPVVNTVADDMFPFMASDGTLYYASKGHVGLGGLDIFEARKAGTSFMTPVNMGYPVNTYFDDFALITEPDGKTGYFSSDRKDYIDRIYGVRMNRTVYTLEGKVLAQQDSSAIPGAAVIVKNETSGDSLRITADSSGRFYAPLDEASDYSIRAGKQKYTLVRPETVTTKSLTASQTLHRDVFMTPGDDPSNPYRHRSNVNVTILVVDCATGKPVPEIDLIVMDLETHTERKMKTNAAGELQLGSVGMDLPLVKELAVINTEYAVEAAEEGYLPTVKKLYFVVRGNEPDGTTLTQTICLDNLQEGGSFELKNIYYDFDKATLRPVSITDLNRVYDFLMRNPDMKVQLSSHTDSRGSDSYNESLSQRRAQSCVDYLVKVKGISANRVVAKGYGETQLKNGCSNGVECTEEEHQANRRTEVKVLKVN